MWLSVQLLFFQFIEKVKEEVVSQAPVQLWDDSGSGGKPAPLGIASDVMWCVPHGWEDEGMRFIIFLLFLKWCLNMFNGFDPMGFPHHQVPPFGRRVLFSSCNITSGKHGENFPCQRRVCWLSERKQIVTLGISLIFKQRFYLCFYKVRLRFTKLFFSEKFARIYNPETQCIWYMYLYIYYKKINHSCRWTYIYICIYIYICMEHLGKWYLGDVCYSYTHPS